MNESFLGHSSAPEGYTGRGSSCSNEMNFGMDIASDIAKIVRQEILHATIVLRLPGQGEN